MMLDGCGMENVMRLAVADRLSARNSGTVG